ncbi:hypothetical protein ACTGVV_11670, partial [Streptococcus suis]
MKRVKNILKFIGLILVIVAINITPMRFIAIQDSMSGAMQWFSGIGYLVIATAIVVWTWKRYKKGRNRPITRYLSNHSLLLYTVIKNKTGGFIMSHPIVPLTIPLSR